MKRRHLLLTMVLSLVSATIASGYALYGPRWATAQVPYYINPANGDGIPETDAIRDIQAAAAAWTAQSNAAVSLYYMGSTSGSTASMNGRNEVFFRNASNNAAAATTYWWSNNNRMTDADVVIWDATYTFVLSNGACSGGLYLQDVLTHEFGHTLGLAHSSVTSATMYPVISYCAAAMRSLDADDLAGIEKLYPAAGANTSPTVAIDSPTTGTIVAEGTVLSFSGSATDPEEGDIGRTMVWTSSISGQIGSGASFSRALSAGSHTITVAATDSGGLTSSRQIALTIQAGAIPSESGPISLSAKKYKVKGSQRVDLAWSGASTGNVDVYRNDVKVLTTPNTGRVTDALNVKGAATYTYRLCEVDGAACSNTVTVVF